MSFRRHYGTGSYGTSLHSSSPLSSTYGSRGMGGYSSPYATPQTSYTPSSYTSYGSYGGKSSRTRSASLPRDTKDRALSRHTSLSRASSPPRATYFHPRLDIESNDSSSSNNSILIDLNAALNRHNNFTGGSKLAGLLSSPRSYNRDHNNHLATAKALARVARSKSVGSSGSISSLSSGYGSRSGSVSDKGDAARSSNTSLSSAPNSRPPSRSTSVGPENGDLDYKKLYEQQLEENCRVHERLRVTENELRQSRENTDLNAKKYNTRMAIADSEKREKRALERKLAEMEEELKQLQKLKAENEKLKAENRALTRVVSKLTNSATSSMSSLTTLSK